MRPLAAAPAAGVLSTACDPWRQHAALHQLGQQQQQPSPAQNAQLPAPQTKHQLEQLFSGVLLDLLAEQPADPMQYIIDWVQAGREQATQDPATGLPRQRREKLLRVFSTIDKVRGGPLAASPRAHGCMHPGSAPERCRACMSPRLQEGAGRISLKAMQDFANKYGGQTLTFDELQLIFRDFKPGNDHLITQVCCRGCAACVGHLSAAAPLAPAELAVQRRCLLLSVDIQPVDAPPRHHAAPQEQFLVFFSKVSRQITNTDFDGMIAEMSR